MDAVSGSSLSGLPNDSMYILFLISLMGVLVSFWQNTNAARTGKTERPVTGNEQTEGAAYLTTAPIRPFGAV
jgi:hypothetical protein